MGNFIDDENINKVKKKFDMNKKTEFDFDIKNDNEKKKKFKTILIIIGAVIVLGLGIFGITKLNSVGGETYNISETKYTCTNTNVVTENTCKNSGGKWKVTSPCSSPNITSDVYVSIKGSGTIPKTKDGYTLDSCYKMTCNDSGDCQYVCKGTKKCIEYGTCTFTNVSASNTKINDSRFKCVPNCNLGYYVEGKICSECDLTIEGPNVAYIGYPITLTNKSTHCNGMAVTWSIKSGADKASVNKTTSNSAIFNGIKPGKVTIEATSNGQSKTHIITVREKKDDTITFNEKTANYTGSAIKANTATALSNTNITYTYYNGTSCSGTALSGAPTDVGNYSVKAVSAGNSEYNSGSKCVTHTINKASTTTELNSLSKKNGVISGNPISKIGNIEIKNGKYTYSYYSDSNCTKTIKEPNANGTYYVKVKLNETKNYNESISKCIVFKVTTSSNSPSQSRLPNGYQEVEYIESTKDAIQYIDTKVVPSNSNELNMSYEVIVSTTSLSSTNNSHIVSTAAVSDKARYNILINPDGKVHFYTNSEAGGATSVKSNDSFKINQKLDIVANADKVNKVASLSVNGSSTSGLFNSNTMVTSNVKLFKINDQNRFVGKMYYFKYIENGKTLREMIPCYRKSDNAIGMYDLINNVFYGNSGTGNFLKGSNKN